MTLTFQDLIDLRDMPTDMILKHLEGLIILDEIKTKKNNCFNTGELFYFVCDFFNCSKNQILYSNSCNSNISIAKKVIIYIMHIKGLENSYIALKMNRSYQSIAQSLFRIKKAIHLDKKIFEGLTFQEITDIITLNLD